MFSYVVESHNLRFGKDYERMCAAGVSLAYAAIVVVWLKHADSENLGLAGGIWGSVSFGSG